jgi:hypothetical protein
MVMYQNKEGHGIGLGLVDEKVGSEICGGGYELEALTC